MGARSVYYHLSKTVVILQLQWSSMAIELQDKRNVLGQDRGKEEQ